MNEATWPAGTLIAMLGDGEISKLIAWCSDGRFSHIGIVVDGERFIEATTGGVKATPLSERCASIQQNPLSEIFSARDANGSPLSAAAGTALSTAARDHVGRAYDTGVLVQLGMVVLVKRRVPEDLAAWPARQLILLALDHLVSGDREKVTCSELVYRVFAEARITPSLRVPLGDPPRINQPFPNVDWVEFVREVLGIYLPKGRHLGLDMGRTSPEDASPEAVSRRIDEVSARLGLAPQAWEPGVPMSPVFVPNPKVVQIPELISSPRFARTVMPPCPAGP